MSSLAHRIHRSPSLVIQRPRSARPVIARPVITRLVITRLVIACMGMTLAAGCAPPASDTPEEAGATMAEADLDFDALAGVLVERMGLQPGERVLLVGVPSRFDPLIPLLLEEVTNAGAEALGAWSEEGEAPSEWSTDFTEALAAASPEARMDLLRDVDVSIMLPGAAATHLVYGELQDVLREGRNRTIHFHWSGAYNLDGTLQEPDAWVDEMYTWVLTATDYRALAAAQQTFEEAMRGSTVRVTTAAGTDISFQIGDRAVTKQDGDASAARMEPARTLIDREVELPAGAIRVAPIETTVHGTVAFPPAVWAGERVEGVTLTFEEGVVVDMSVDGDIERVEMEMETGGPAARSFREFALGFNPLLAIPDGEPWIPYYGYGAGVVRLSLGDNSELGGNVGGGYVRWNFFTDATVEVDGEVWVADGRLVRCPARSGEGQIRCLPVRPPQRPGG